MATAPEIFIDDEIERSAAAIEEFDLDSCRQLYLSIIELAVHDYRFLRKMRSQTKSSRYDRKKLRQMTEDGDPLEFFESRWFEQVCDYIGVKPQLIRERLEMEDELDLTKVM
jgi:hypothetical protein